jgi:hypothetical protein
MKNHVLHLLATASPWKLFVFKVKAAFVGNFLEQRSNTVFFTLDWEYLGWLLGACRDLDVTLQRIDVGGGNESYTTLHQGQLPPWAPGLSREGGNHDVDDRHPEQQGLKLPS